MVTRRSSARKTAPLLRGIGRAALLLLVASTWAAGDTAPPRFDEALAQQEKRVMEHPTDIAALNDLGNLLAQVGELPAAEAAYRRSLELDPSHVPSRYNLALVLLEQGHRREARGELHRVLDDRPTHAWAHYQLGAIYEEQGNRGRAIRQYAKAFALDGSLADSLYNPHVVGSDLVTEALLESYEQQIPAVQVPRSYSEPERVTQLLLPAPVPAEVEPEPQPPTVEVESAQEAPRPRRRPQKFHGSFGADAGPAASETGEASGQVGSGGEADQPMALDDDPGLSDDEDDFEADDTEDAVYDQQADDEASDLASERARERRERREQRNTSSGLPGLIDGVVVGPGSGQASQQGAGSTTRPPTSRPPSNAPPVSGSSSPPSGFTPGVTSTGRLDLELLPLADPQPAVIAG
jgi:Tetratricopeptide repeat